MSNKITPERRKELLEAQRKLCSKHNHPHFAPSDGYCWSCRSDVVSERWAQSLITGCPNCHRSYCD